jgi:hypothetical protein
LQNQNQQQADLLVKMFGRSERINRFVVVSLPASLASELLIFLARLSLAVGKRHFRRRDTQKRQKSWLNDHEAKFCRRHKCLSKKSISFLILKIATSYRKARKPKTE